MRYVGDITTTDSYKIGLYTWNEKYIVRIEAGSYEQVFKVSQLDFLGTDEDIHAIFKNEVFIGKILDQFRQMHQDWQQILSDNELI